MSRMLQLLTVRGGGCSEHLLAAAAAATRLVASVQTDDFINKVALGQLRHITNESQ